ncbi:hypothetical protein DPMN_035002 [Dreissena polymorpha]|uniref:Uncharacterized protein n=1 Tax=Dreissena polymorpha TaxID=45954 RepID=A0A9D4M8G0_DREPO|nr:hypothetical protein DPMN_035002 [Dreissena polymorpha]
MLVQIQSLQSPDRIQEGSNMAFIPYPGYSYFHSESVRHSYSCNSKQGLSVYNSDTKTQPLM